MVLFTLVHMEMIECDAAIFALLGDCVLSDRPPALWWLITRISGMPLHDAVGTKCENDAKTDIKA